MSDRALDIVDRLRGIYRIPIRDGLGAVGGGEEPDNPDEFVRKFPTTLIQERSADLIEQLYEALKLLLSSAHDYQTGIAEAEAAIRKAEGND